jgi:hypothetical protein
MKEIRLALSETAPYNPVPTQVQPKDFVFLSKGLQEVETTIFGMLNQMFGVQLTDCVVLQGLNVVVVKTLPLKCRVKSGYVMYNGHIYYVPALPQIELPNSSLTETDYQLGLRLGLTVEPSVDEDYSPVRDHDYNKTLNIHYKYQAELVQTSQTVVPDSAAYPSGDIVFYYARTVLPLPTGANIIKWLPFVSNVLERVQGGTLEVTQSTE